MTPLSSKKKGLMVVALVVAILLVDQAVKLWVKTHMTLHESIPVCSWFQIVFIENNGMAYGLELGSKLLLSLLRVALIVIISIGLALNIRRGARTGFVVCVAMIIAGAIGNMIDGMFYGLIFTGSTPFNVAHLVPFGMGYEDFLRGRVVDMLYFPLISFYWPDWMPVVAGREFVFFSPVFNIADANISVGVIVLVLFFRKDLSEAMKVDWKPLGKKVKAAGEGPQDEKA